MVWITVFVNVYMHKFKNQFTPFLSCMVHFRPSVESCSGPFLIHNSVAYLCKKCENLVPADLGAYSDRLIAVLL